MANPEHLAILKQGVAAWNAWREQNPDVGPDLDGADLQGEQLPGASLGWADLHGANLSSALSIWGGGSSGERQGVGEAVEEGARDFDDLVGRW